MGDIWLAGKVEVRPLGGSALPAPPARRCTVLLTYLAERYPNWTSRKEIGEAIHPDSTSSKRQGSVRQTLSRLRSWLPDNSIEFEQKNVRLTKPWRLLLGDAEGLMIAPGLDHPWMDEFRLRHSSEPKAQPQGSERLLFETIASLSKTNPEVARNLLCAAPEIALMLPRSELAWVIGVTKPRSRSEPNAAEHDLLIGESHLAVADIKEAIHSYLRAYKTAVNHRNVTNMARASAQVMFAFLESGDMDSATEWLERLTKADREQSMRLLVLNAKAAFFWNSHLVPEALATLRSAERYATGASRVEKLHYYANLAVLEAEAGDQEAANETIETARAMITDPSHRGFRWNLMIAEAEIRANEGNHAEANAIIDQALLETSNSEATLANWYVRELQAEVAAIAGATARAHSLWRHVESERTSRNLALTPRLQARKQRIFR